MDSVHCEWYRVVDGVHNDGIAHRPVLGLPLLIPVSSFTFSKALTMQIQPYLFFDGCCEQAIDFYCGALGAQRIELMRFKDSPEPFAPGAMPPGIEDKVMHASFQIGDATVLASDGRCVGQPGTRHFDGFALTLTAEDNAQAERLFARLSDGGQVQMPLSETFFSSRFGTVADRFGVTWMVVVAPESRR